MKILSLFDGMACGMIAMKNAGIDVETYDAYEIDKFAVKTATHNFPTIEEHGDVFAADFTKYRGCDFLIGGSPCTYWSIAQTKNRETVASGIGWELFSQYLRALHEARPRFFIYENNKSMSKEIRSSIDEAFGFEAVLINSALVSAQNRNRLYWVGKRNADGSYSKVDVEQPIDKGILLRDVLRGGVDLTSNDKSFVLTASYDGAVAWNTIERHQRSMVAEPVCVAMRGRMYCGQKQHYEARADGKTNTLTSVEKDNRVAEPVTDICQVGALPMPNGEMSTSAGFRVYSPDAKARYLCANGGGAGAKTGLYALSADEPIYATPCEWDDDGNPIKATSCADGKIYTVYKVDNGRIIINGKEYHIKLADGFYIIRKLTVSEYKRLQTVPDWYEFPVSDAQAYKMLGNGWTCDVITHLIKSCLAQ